MGKYRLLLRHHGKKFRPLLHGIACGLCAFLILGTFFYAADPYDNRILEGVSIGGLDVGGMSPEEAYRALQTASRQVLEGSNLTILLPSETLALSPGESEVSLDCFSAVRAACQVGRRDAQSPQIGLLPYLELNTDRICSMLADYAQQYNTTCTPSYHQLKGIRPDLEIESNSQEGQTLELTLGLPTARLDQKDALNRILSVYDTAFSGTYRVSNFKVDILEEPESPDLYAIYQDVYIAPVNDSIDLQQYKIVPGAWGYHFDIRQAQQRISRGKYGETISIPLIFQEPDIFGDEVYFRDVLGHCETKHTNDENRNNNLRRACSSMNGLILEPGEVFSYNDTLGPRTKANGYLRAGAYSGWELVQSYGGGICQGSTTIYGAALDADLEIVHRRNHGYMVNYVQPGLDATVNWGGPDFQFRNSSHFPIKIAAEVSDGFVRVTIFGTEERDYYVEMESESQWGSETIYAQSYKCKYSRETGELLSRELEARSNYMR